MQCSLGLCLAALNNPLIYECLQLHKGGDACVMTIQAMKALSAVY